MTPPERTAPLPTAKLLVLLCSVIAGVGAALLVMPTIFRHTPTDISRIGSLLDALNDPTQHPKIAVFGNSAVMSGLDAEQLTAELPDKPLAWNLASTGQSLVESAMLTQAIPSSVDTSIYTTHLLTSPTAPPLLPVKNNTFHIYGWRPTDEMLQVFAGVYGDGVVELVTRPHLSQLFEARWALRQFLDTRLRIFLRTDLNLAAAEDDLLHPQRYAVSLTGDVLARRLADRNEQLSIEPPKTSDADRELVRTLAVRASRLGRRTVVLVPPVHPVEFEAHSGAFRSATRSVETTMADIPDTIVIDATRALEASHFIDDLHMTNEGARILTSLVAKRMREDF